MMIFRYWDTVVSRDGRVGKIRRIFYDRSTRWYLVQFGSGGPFEKMTGDRLRLATANEDKELSV